MVEQLYVDYRDLGGSLDEETYGGLRGQVGEMETNPIPVDRAFIDQHTGVTITREEKLVCSKLREGVFGRFFGDQAITAEAMLVVMGNSQEREAYMRGYSPQVNFRINLMQILAPGSVERVLQTLSPRRETLIFKQ